MELSIGRSFEAGSRCCLSSTVSMCVLYRQYSLYSSGRWWSQRGQLQSTSGTGPCQIIQNTKVTHLEFASSKIKVIILRSMHQLKPHSWCTPAPPPLRRPPRRPQRRPVGPQGLPWWDQYPPQHLHHPMHLGLTLRQSRPRPPESAITTWYSIPVWPISSTRRWQEQNYCAFATVFSILSGPIWGQLPCKLALFL